MTINMSEQKIINVVESLNSEIDFQQKNLQKFKQNHNICPHCGSSMQLINVADTPSYHECPDCLWTYGKAYQIIRLSKEIIKLKRSP